LELNSHILATKSPVQVISELGIYHIQPNLISCGSGTIGQTKKAFLTGLFAEKDYILGTDLKKKEIADILLSDATIQDQNI
jgi:hypothetical protein